MHCLKFGEIPSGIEAILHKVSTEPPISPQDFAVYGGLDLNFK